LLEVVCVVAIIALIVAVALPALPRATSPARLEAYAVEVATLLRADRDAAIRKRSTINSEISASFRYIKSGATGHAVRLPSDVHLDAVLPSHCHGRQGLAAITFLASGMSCGGTITLTRLGTGFQIRVNWLTGGVEVERVNAS
jgi:general secretion pathway protein H